MSVCVLLCAAHAVLLITQRAFSHQKVHIKVRTKVCVFFFFYGFTLQIRELANLLMTYMSCRHHLCGLHVPVLDIYCSVDGHVSDIGVL